METKNLTHLTPSPSPLGGEGSKNDLSLLAKIIRGVRREASALRRQATKGLLFATIAFVGCTSQDDGEVMFSDTERAIINTLIYAAPSSDPTNAYESSSTAADLGQKFFWDKQFSGNIVIVGNRDTSTFTTATPRLINCVTCHDPDFGWADKTSKPNDVSLGANFTSKNSPTVLNTAFNTYSLWDGAIDSVWGVMRPAIEGNPHNFGRMGVAYVICQNTVYQPAYISVFGGGSTPAEIADLCPTAGLATNPIGSSGTACGGSACTPSSTNNFGRSGLTAAGSFGSLSTTRQGYVNKMFANFGKAIAAYERKLVSKNSAFDRWAAGTEGAMSVAQKRGLKIFVGKGNCVRCHSGPNFSDGKFHNLGVPQVGGFSGSNDQGRYDGISTLVTGSNSTFNTAGSFNDSPSINRVSGLSASSSTIGQFKTPTLRDAVNTPPYFHNGTFASLWDVVNFYNFAGDAGNFPGTKDTILTTRHMTNEEMEDLVKFLQALEGEALDSSLRTGPCASTSNICGTTTGW